MFARSFRWLVLLSLVAALRAAAADVEFLRVWPAWREAESFERISEFFDGRENTGRQVVLRSQNETRAGFYFLVRTRSGGGGESGAKFELNVILPTSPEPKTFTFPADVPAKEKVFLLGLTGKDWPGGKETSPVAWRLRLRGGDGRVLAEAQSFLWAKPTK